MKILKVLFILFFMMTYNSYAEKIPGTNIEEKIFQLNINKKSKSDRTYSELVEESRLLNQYIGGYPPKFTDENQRSKIYKQWLSLISDAEAYSNLNPGTESSYYIIAELYRQGHNLDVKGSAEEAHKALQACISSFPKSTICNFSSFYFYLSVGPNFLTQAEKSLNILRNNFHPKLDPEVESGYVILYIQKQDVKNARKQIDKYLKHFPNTARAKDFLMIKKDLGDSIKVINY